MQNSMVVFTFSILDWKYSFWASLVQKIKFVNLSWNLVPRLSLKCAEFNGDIHFISLKLEIPLLRKFGPKTQNYQFKLKFWAKSNAKMQNSMLILSFSVFDFFFLGKFGPKIQNFCSKWNLIPRLIQICRIQWRCSLFISFRLEIYILGIFGLKNCQFTLKFGRYTNSNMKNSMMMFIFLFLTGIIVFFWETCLKNQNCLLKLKVRT